jgi:hypothetical protein
MKGRFLIRFAKIAAVAGAILTSSAAMAAPRVCVLVYERAGHPFSVQTKKIFASDANADVTVEAVPANLMDCMLGDYEEVILIAHAVEDPKNKKLISLGYFKPLSSDEVQQGIQDGELVPGSKPAGWELGQPLYQVEEFLPEIFRAIHDGLAAKRAAGQEISLKRIRWMSCLPKSVFKAYPEFKTILDEFNIALDVAPKQLLMSTIMRESVTGYDRLWLAESAQPDEAPSPDAWFFSYVDLKTFFVFETGSSVALHGRYRVKYKGIALGLSSRWTELFIQYKDVEGMEVGERRSVKGPRFDFSAGLLEDVEFDLLPFPKFGLPSDLNSAGLSLSLWADIEVERLY